MADLHELGVIVSVLARTRAELTRSVERVSRATGDARADVVELRLDHLPDATELELRELFAHSDRPVLATIHGAAGFRAPAAPAVSDDDRFELLQRAARAGADFVDLDAALVPQRDELPPGVRRILSLHPRSDVALGSQDLERLVRPLDAAARPELDLTKLVPHADDAEEALDLLRWLAQRRAAGAPPTIAFCTGRASLSSRVLAPAYGSAGVFAAPDADGGAVQLAAPGQPTVTDVRSAWPLAPDGGGRPPTAGCALLGIAGRPLDHSASPRVHGAAQRAADVDATFVALEARSLDGLLERLADLDAPAPRWLGLSVTAPFKSDALRLAAEADEATRALGAANTLRRLEGGGWRASNTDAPAVAAALEAAGARLPGCRATVVGAGGAARAAVHALRTAGAEVLVLARRAEASKALARDFEGVASATLVVRPTTARAEDVDRIIVHTTPLGTGGHGRAPVDAALLDEATHVLDAVYLPQRTGLLRRAALAGAAPVPGAAWFLSQAALQFDAFHGVGSPPEEQLARALAEHVANRAAPTLIVLIGLRCSGKSTLARALAPRVGADLVDLDDALVQLAQNAGDGDFDGAGEVLAALGETRFRELEFRALEEVLRRPRRPLVLATGGGVVEDPRSRDLLADPGEAARILWLRAPLAVLAARLERSAELRPSLTGADPGQELALLAERREPFYRALADAQLDAAADGAALLDAAVRALHGGLEISAAFGR